MADLFAKVQQFLDIDDWPTTAIIPGEQLNTHFAGDGGLYEGVLRIDNLQGALVFALSAPKLVPPHKRELAVHILNILNWNMALGCFDMEYDTGQIRYRVGLVLGDHPLTFGLLKPVLYTPIMTMDQYWPEIALRLDMLE